MNITEKPNYTRPQLRLITEPNADEILLEIQVRGKPQLDIDVEQVRKNFEAALKELKARHRSPEQPTFR